MYLFYGEIKLTQLTGIGRTLAVLFAAVVLALAALGPISGQTPADRAYFPANPEIKLGKKVVLVSGDEEYRTEEYFTALAKILSRRHGFDCVALYAVDPKTGKIDPDVNTNIPGLDELRDADCLILSTRRRVLPDAQMKEFDDYLRRGKPVLGTRTATHAFSPDALSAYFYYADGYDGAQKPDWKDGFGRKILGENWVAHHGNHAHEATGTLTAPGAENDPILRGVGRIFVPSDVYRVRLPMLDTCRPLLLGEVLDGMTADSLPVQNEKNDPVMPVAWRHTYRIDDSAEGDAVVTTLGSAVDFSDENFRRFLVNAVYSLCGLDDRIADQSCVDFCGPYYPTMFGFGSFHPAYHVQPKELEL